ncbi:TetR/AcrR family transcriptional regulator [Halobacillus litoralis]|uniref:TetR/AcrR family transcriptional regulator n=1 Tax=Halobacillus litoralis TaxID=45668 RepID=UPI001CD483A7|nr:TetR/AcrR family transcriptional regulator [Halobacillus litoralis]MCA0968966.1 TetR/AcrR family transcriptional regulator [Halobacillus litoralis]
MGRKKVLTKEDVFTVTGEVLREEGLHGVHFKNISNRLDVGRSTLYEYFSNKDELLLAYMKQLMKEMNDKVDDIEEDLPPNRKLYRLLLVLLEHAQLHQIDRMIRDLQSSDKHAAMFYRDELHIDLMKTYDLMQKWIEEAKQTGIWKTTIDSSLIGDLIFHSILFPNRERLGVEQMADQLFEMIEYGMEDRS